MIELHVIFHNSRLPKHVRTDVMTISPALFDGYAERVRYVIFQLTYPQRIKGQLIAVFSCMTEALVSDASIMIAVFSCMTKALVSDASIMIATKSKRTIPVCMNIDNMDKNIT